jgi:hypothetical protein
MREIRGTPTRASERDTALAAGHHLRALPEVRRFQISVRSRCTAMLAGFRTLIQTRHGPDRYAPSIFFDTMPSAPSWHAWAGWARALPPGFHPTSIGARQAPDSWA